MDEWMNEWMNELQDVQMIDQVSEHWGRATGYSVENHSLLYTYINTYSLRMNECNFSPVSFSKGYICSQGRIYSRPLLLQNNFVPKCKPWGLAFQGLHMDKVHFDRSDKYDRLSPPNSSLHVLCTCFSRYWHVSIIMFLLIRRYIYIYIYIYSCWFCDVYLKMSLLMYSLETIYYFIEFKNCDEITFP